MWGFGGWEMHFCRDFFSLTLPAHFFLKVHPLIVPLTPPRNNTKLSFHRTRNKLWESRARNMMRILHWQLITKCYYQLDKTSRLISCCLWYHASLRFHTRFEIGVNNSDWVRSAGHVSRFGLDFIKAENYGNTCRVICFSSYAVLSVRRD